MQHQILPLHIAIQNGACLIDHKQEYIAKILCPKIVLCSASKIEM